MRCSECDHIMTRQSTGRLKDGRIVFGWCRGCFEVAGVIETELSPAVQLFNSQKQIALPFGGTSWDSQVAQSRQRMFVLTILASILGFWGLTMLIAGFARSDEPTPINPLGNGSAGFLIAGGGSLIGTAAGLMIGVIRVKRRLKQPCSKPKPKHEKLLAHGAALMVLTLISLAVRSVEPRFSAVAVMLSTPLLITSWLSLNDTTSNAVESSIL